MSGALPRGLRWVGPGATFVLVLLCLALGAGVALTLLGSDRTPSTRPSTERPVTSVAAREAALEGAGPLTERVLSYDWEGFDGVVEETRGELLSSGFGEEYAAQMASLRPRVVRDRVTVRATARQVGVVSAGPDRAVALVFADQVSTTQGSPGRRSDQVRVLVTLSADEGVWRVSRMDAF